MNVGDRVVIKKDLPAFKSGEFFALNGHTGTIVMVGVLSSWVVHDGTKNWLEVSNKDLELVKGKEASC